MNILSYFDRDDTTYSAYGIVMFTFKDARKNDFLIEGVEYYRRAFIADEDLDNIIKQLGGTRKERIAEQIPSKPDIKSGDFGEILTYLLFQAIYPDYNVHPIRWRWQEDINRSVHFADIMWLCCPDVNNPQTTDKLMTIEVKTRATNPGRESSINEAIAGAKKDCVTRDSLTLAYMKRQFLRDKQYQDANIVERFEKAVKCPYYAYYNAMAIVESNYFTTCHIKNLDRKLISEVENWNLANAANNRKMSVFVAPVAELKKLYEDMYQNVLNS